MASEKAEEYQQKVRELANAAEQQLQKMGISKEAAQEVVRLRGGVDEVLGHLRSSITATQQAYKTDAEAWRAISRDAGAYGAQRQLAIKDREDGPSQRQSQGISW